MKHIVTLIILATLMQPALGQNKKEDFISIFDGKTLNGWQGDTSMWRVEKGVLVGEVKPGKTLKNNSFLTWKGGQPGDFELKAEFRITEEGNSGINYRSEVFNGVPFALKGYQADIDGRNVYTGQNYEERGRTFLARRGERSTLEAGKPPAISTLGNADSLKRFIHVNDWNTCHLVVKGNRMQHFINGVLMSDVTDNDAVLRKLSGLLGVQVHVGPPMKVMYRNIRLKSIK